MKKPTPSMRSFETLMNGEIPTFEGFREIVKENERLEKEQGQKNLGPDGKPLKVVFSQFDV